MLSKDSTLRPLKRHQIEQETAAAVQLACYRSAETISETPA